MSQNLFFADRAPVSAAEARIEGVGVGPLDARRVDVAVDVTPCLEALRVEFAIVGPDGAEWASATLLDNRDWALDKMLHLRRDAEPGAYTLHVGLFHGEQLIHHLIKTYTYPPEPVD